MNIKKRFTAMLLAALIILSLCACSSPARTDGEFTYTAEISTEKQAELDKVLSEFMRCYEEDDAEGAQQLFSADFGATVEDTKAFFSQLHGLAKNPFVKYDGYYMNGLTVGEALIKVKKAPEDPGYIELTPASSEMYCALYASEGEKISYLLSMLLIPKGNSFKIAWIGPGDFKYDGQDAPAIYEKTKKLYEDKNLIGAYITSCMLGNTLRPAGYMRYANDLKMEDMCYKLYTEIQDAHKLPLELPGLSNKVYEIGIAKDEEHGIIPLFFFDTVTPISETEKLKKEAGAVIKALDSLSPGLISAFEYACFDITNDKLTEETTSVKKERITIPLN